MDSEKWSIDHCFTRQSPPTPVCGEIGEDTKIYDQGESLDLRRPWQTLGSTGTLIAMSIKKSSTLIEMLTDCLTLIVTFHFSQGSMMP